MREREVSDASCNLSASHLPFIMMYFAPIAHRELPIADSLGSRLAKMHRDRVSQRVPYFGSLRSNCGDTKSRGPVWSRVFEDMLIQLCLQEAREHGSWLVDDSEYEEFISVTLRKLLEPLDEHIKPSLVHGNLSADNMGIHLGTSDPFIWSPRSIYAHNEYELGIWRLKTQPLDSRFFEAYRRYYPPDHPVEQWDDRIRLYSIKFNLSLTYRHNLSDVRDQILHDIRILNKNRRQRRNT
ncbi:Fructosamine kinase-domain-containing protein [Xylariales sp. PMI_506]|nr:Fructosamine kinase-domain-containing protein [Xylariales sp. PMI_506]